MLKEEAELNHMGQRGASVRVGFSGSPKWADVVDGDMRLRRGEKGFISRLRRTAARIEEPRESDALF